MVKVSDYIFDFLLSKGVKICFMLPGGGAMHLVDSLGVSGMEYVCFQHEQGAGCAAEAYGQFANTPALLLVTSGPGVTNALTPVTAGWIDSTPMFVISGQAKRQDLVGDSGVRQIGSQEVPTVKIVSAVTKYCVEVREPSEIKYHLERAWHEASTGRPGPVWLSVPLDVQGAQVDAKKLQGYEAGIDDIKTRSNECAGAALKTIELLKQSKRPLMLIGNGVKLANAQDSLYELLDILPVPVQTTWKTIDIINETHPLYVGHPGIMGDRGANLILQQADLLISVGSRLDTSLTAFDDKNFAKNAKRVIVDIDINELNRMKMDKEVALAADARDFLTALKDACDGFDMPAGWEEWRLDGKALRQKYPVVKRDADTPGNIYVSAYKFIDELCDLLTEYDVIVPESSGGAGEITYQAFRLKKGQLMKNAAGLGSMGFGLPYSIGACIAAGGARTVLINGDGAFQLNIQELETLRRLWLPVKIFVWCNGGYASIRAMQSANFGRHVASGEQSGYTVPDVAKIAAAYGIPTFAARNNKEMEQVLPKVLQTDGPCLCALYTDPNETISPRVKAVPQPDGSMKSGALENMWPQVE